MSSTQSVVQKPTQLAPYISGVLASLVGSTLVLGTVVLMNELSAPPERKELEKKTEFTPVEKQKPKPKKQVTRPKPRPRRTPKAPPRPMMSSLSSNLAGIAFDLPGLQFEDLGNQGTELLQTDDEVVHTSDTVDTAPQAVEQMPPTYPKRASDRGIEGYVELSVLIDQNGYIQQVKVLEAKPPDVFEEAATETVRNWRFTPALYKGEPVSSWARQKITFRLQRR